MFVDADANLRQDVGSYLRSSGDDLQEAADFQSALRLIEAQEFDLIISDVSLPGGSVRELAAAAARKNPDTVVIVHSGIDTVQEGVRAVKREAGIE